MYPVSEEQLHAYVDNELPAAQRMEVEHYLAEHPEALAQVEVWREQKRQLHALYDPLLAQAHDFEVPVRRNWHGVWRRSWPALAASCATLAVGLAGGWFGHERVMIVRNGDPGRNFAAHAAVAHAAYSPEVRHPVEVPAEQEAHLVNWLSKRLAAPVRAPHLASAGWDLLGGRLLPGEPGPVAQFMYQDRGGRRITLLVSHKAAPAGNSSAFRYEQRQQIGVFYWVDGAYNYALSAELPRAELLTLADAVYRELNRDPAATH